MDGLCLKEAKAILMGGAKILKILGRLIVLADAVLAQEGEKAWIEGVGKRWTGRGPKVEMEVTTRPIATASATFCHVGEAWLAITVWGRRSRDMWHFTGIRRQILNDFGE